jgi:hypothetical protein
MNSYPPQALYYIADALLCIAYLVGIVAGVIALARKKILPGVLAIVAFLFFGLQIVLNILIWGILVNRVPNYGVLNWASFCIGTPLGLFGGIALVVLVFLNIGKKETLPPPPPVEEFPPPQS